MTSISDGEGGLSVRTKLNASFAVTDAFSVSSGNVGIGTTSPSVKLDVSSAGALTARVRNTASTATAGFDATNTTGSALFGVDAVGAFTYTGTAIPIRFSTNAAERMRIDASGNVGIGVTPTVSLQVGGVAGGNRTFQMGSAGATRFAITTDGTNGLTNIGCTNDSTTGALAFQSGATLTERMRIDASGNVGIGTTSPNAASIVDAQSTTKGVRFPNMTTTQKNAIANVAGNVVFDTTLGKLCVNTGSGWQTITSA